MPVGWKPLHPPNLMPVGLRSQSWVYSCLLYLKEDYLTKLSQDWNIYMNHCDLMGKVNENRDSPQDLNKPNTETDS
jgi:hypothetical protein